jgi:hypothetical protein
VGGHPEYGHCASLDLHDGQDVEPAQSDGVEGEEVGGQQTCGRGTQEGSPVGVGLRWCRAEPAAVRIRRMVAVATRCPRPTSSPGRRRWPQQGFSCARRSTSSRISSLIGGGLTGWDKSIFW